MTQALFLRPDSSLVFRTGRPFGAAGDFSGDDVYGFPMPGTLAGAFRAASIDATGAHPSSDLAHKLLQLRGPLRCVLRGQQATVFVPAPGDALVTDPVPDRRGRKLLRAGPQPMSGSGTDLPYGLLPVQDPQNTECAEPVEPAKGWWTLLKAASWLSERAPLSEAAPEPSVPEQRDLPGDRRIHAVIDSATLRSPDQGLHTSAGVEFLLADGQKDQGLLMLVDGELSEAVGVMGGRRGRVGADGRTGVYLPLPAESVLGLSCPPALKKSLESVQVNSVLRLWLATPACYLRNGWYPDGLKPVDNDHGHGQVLRGALVGLPGWTFELVAAVVPRFATHAGAAMRRTDGLPGFERRALRRLAPAGSVYWLKVIAKGDDHLHTRWLQPTCYAEYARDGHGLALIGLA